MGDASGEDAAGEALAQLLDAEGYGGWIDTDQMVQTLRENAEVVAAALGFQRYGWVDNFGEVHGESTHADCDPEPPCVAVYRVDIGRNAAGDG